MTKFCDFITNQDGLYQVPSFAGFIEQKTWDKFSELVGQHRDGTISIAAFKKNPTLLDEWDRAQPLLNKLPPFSYKMWGSGPTVVYRGAYVASGNSFGSRLNNTRPSDKQTTSSKDWNWEMALEFSKDCPNLPQIFQILHKAMLKHNPNSFPYPDVSVASYNSFQKQHTYLTSGAWTAHKATHEDRITRKMEGKGVAVYLNESKCYLSSNNQTTESLAGAKMYESMEAAKRSLKSMGGMPQSISYVEVDVKVSKILEHTGNVESDLREVGALKEKEDLIKEVLAHQHPVAEPELTNAAKRKNKM